MLDALPPPPPPAAIQSVRVPAHHVPAPGRWRIKVALANGEFAGSDVMHTTPKNAVRTARYLRKHGYRKVGRFLDPLFVGDVRAQAPPKKLARQLIAAARKAKNRRGKVAFFTEGGGYPWRATPYVWKARR